MSRLGVSLYPDKSEFEQDIAYLQMAKVLGYQRVFMSFLQIDIKNPKRSIKRIRESAQKAKEIGMEVTLDIHPMVFKYLNLKEDDLTYFHEMGIGVLRLDTCYDGKMEAMMTHNPYGIKIEVNMSNDTHYLSHILDYQADCTKLMGSHNFYPQRFTGLSLPTFLSCSEKFKQHHIESAAFITSQSASISPWPVQEGLCTLEDHRDLPLVVQARHMKMLQLVDDVIIGNAYASEQELQDVANVFQSEYDVLHVDVYEGVTSLERELMFQGMHEYRGDASAYVIRSSKKRMEYHKAELKKNHSGQDIHKGDVLILNEDYGQYKAELQIALQDRRGDPRINVVGRIVNEEGVLLDAMRPFQKFILEEEA